MVGPTAGGTLDAIHAPKREVFDLENRTNVDPKGFVRPVDEFRVEQWGLYMARSSDHPHFDYLESWLLPALGLRASVFHYLPAHARDQDYYIDVGEFEAGATQWTSVDHYLDISVRTGRGYDLLDVDELFDARVAGHLDTPTAEVALTRSITAIEGLLRHNYDVNAWLASVGMPIHWRGAPS